VAEGMSQTLVETICAPCSAMPNCPRNSTVSIAVYHHNHSPTCAVLGKTPGKGETGKAHAACMHAK